MVEGDRGGAMNLDDLLARATDRVVVNPSDGKSGARFEKLTVDGQRYFLKVLSYDADWIMRCSGNTDFWEYKVWHAGLYDRVPPEIDHTIVAMSLEAGRLSLLARDVSEHLIPEGDDLVTAEQADAFMDHMAAFHAAYWGWRDDVGLSSIEQRIGFFSDANVAREMQAADPPSPIVVAQQGWSMLRDRSPALADLVEPIRADPTRLADALRALPVTFVAGDWKMGNLGYNATTKQTILLDWAYPGSCPGLWELMWYLGVNRARLPRSKEDTIACYRDALERRGVATAGWWDDAVGLCALAQMCMMGWEKAVGDDDELRWWEDFVSRTGGRPA
ncbi:MAG TPA: hypothetical protein VHC63_07235 [Acidimicrobiales bacterium]|nr:hypothetical protein [Acidimicrobiales bacterium]